jgi:hypothetical protein
LPSLPVIANVFTDVFSAFPALSFLQETGNTETHAIRIDSDINENKFFFINFIVTIVNRNTFHSSEGASSKGGHPKHPLIHIKAKIGINPY